MVRKHKLFLFAVAAALAGLPATSFLARASHVLEVTVGAEGLPLRICGA